MILFALSISLVALVLILSPFWLGRGGHLAAAASINSTERLESVKELILQRFIDEEQAFVDKKISKLAWDQRRQYLSNRYIDASRRLDFLKSMAQEQLQKNQGTMQGGGA